MNIRIKHLLMLMALTIVPLVACNATNSGNKAETAAEAAGDTNLPLDLGFLEKQGVDVSGIKDICDITDYVDWVTLNEEQVLKLLPMVALMGEDELLRGYDIRGARALPGGFTMLLYSVETGDDSTTELLAIYDKNGKLTDYMQLDDWDQFEVIESDDAFNKGRAHVTDTKLTFTKPNEFTLDETVREGNWERVGEDGPMPRELTHVKWLVETLRRYTLDDKGHMTLAEEKIVKSEGDVDPDYKADPIMKLYLLPASDPNRIDRLNNMMNGLIAKQGLQDFDDERGWSAQFVVSEIFAANPEGLLNWIYKNRNGKSVIVDYLKKCITTGWRDKEILDQEIEKMSDKAAQKYFKELTANWEPEE